MSFNRRLEKLEHRAREFGESNNNLGLLTIPWPDEDGGPIHCMAKLEVIEKIVKIYGNR